MTRAAPGSEQGAGEAVAPGALTELLRQLASAPAAPADEGWDRALRPGARIGRFELVRECGRGGFGVVFEARDHELGRAVAFKALRPGRLRPSAATRLHDEAEAIARLAHPNIVVIHDAGAWSGGPYLILELLRGETLAERLSRGRPDLAGAVRIALGVARGIAHAHRAGVVHRDLKPANVFLTEDGGVKVLDFGLARVFGRAGVEGGTPAFMAPEQWRGGDEDERTDVFAAGALLYVLLAGEAPYPTGDGRGPPDFARPPPPLRRVPRRLADLVARALAPDAARRPRDGAALAEALEEIDAALAQHRRSRLAALAAALVVAAVGGAAGGRWWVQRNARPSGPIPIAVADAANETGDPALDGVAGLLATSLEQSRRLSVVPHSRLADLAAREGARPARLDGSVAVRAARDGGARLLLAPAVRRRGGGVSLEVKALQAADGAPVFALHEDGAAAPALVDRLSARVREALDEREEEVRASQVEVARQITGSLEAYQHYERGQRCLERPGDGQTWTYASCAEDLRAALAADPGFSLANYALALLAVEQGDAAAARAPLEAALARLDRMPPRERTWALALDAWLDGRTAEAFARYGGIVESAPQDKRSLFFAGDVLFHAHEVAGSVPFFERLLELDPEHENALSHLVLALGPPGRDRELRAHAERWSRQPRGAGRLHALSHAWAWLGERDRAVEAARTAVAERDGDAAREDLVRALAFAGRHGEAEAEARALVRRAKDPAPPAQYALAAILGVQGRRREATAVLDALRRDVAATPNLASAWRAKRAAFAIGFGPRAHVDEGCAPEVPADRLGPCAVGLALRGELARAERLLPRLDETGAAEVRALLAWRRGEVDGALAALRELERRDPLPWPLVQLAPSYLRGEVAAAAGRHAEAIEALRRFERLYTDAPWRAWALPRSLYLRARAERALGSSEHARRDLDALLRLWSDADPDLELLREARALRRSL